MAALFTLLGCAMQSAQSLNDVPDAPIELSDGEGLLIVSIDSELPMTRLYVGEHHLPQIRSRGEFRLVRIPAGRYRFETALMLNYQRTGTSFLDLSGMNEYAFEVKAGFINYPGTLILERTRYKDWYTGRLLNRSAAALRELQARFPELLTTLPVRYAGSARDDYLAEYFEAENALGPAPSSASP